MTLRITCIAFVALALAGGCKPSERTTGWRTVRNQDPSFSVEMPGQPKAVVAEAGVQGSLSVNDGPEDAYVIKWSRVDPRWLTTQNEAALDRGRVISDNRINENERTSIVQLGRGGIEVVRLVVVGDLGYMLSGIAREQRSAKRFADSFTLGAPAK